MELFTEVLLSSLSAKQRRCRRRLSLVCHSWHKVIFQVPLFWTDVGLHRSMREFQDILRNNPRGPLDVSWTPQKPTKYMDVEMEKRFFIVLTESHRWRSLTIAGHISEEMQAQFMGLATPNLHYLNVCHYPNPFDPDMVTRIILSPTGSLLREVVLGVATLDWSCARIAGLRILRLHALNEGRPSLLELHQVLSNSPELELFSISGWSSLDAEDITKALSSLQVVNLPSLTTLIIDKVHPSVSKTVLSLVQAPQCKYLHIRAIEMNALQEVLQPSHLVPLLLKPAEATAHQLFLSYNYDTGGIIIGLNKELEYPTCTVRRPTRKLSGRSGIHVEIITGEGSETNHPSHRNELLSILFQEVLQPAFSGLDLHVELQIYNSSDRDTTLENPNRPNFELLYHLPLITHLRICDTFSDHSALIEYLSHPHITPGGRADIDRKERWLFPRLQAITSECDPFACDDIIEDLDDLALSKRVDGQTEPGLGDLTAPLKSMTLWSSDGDDYMIKDWTSDRGWSEE